MTDWLLWLFLPWVYHWRETRRREELWGLFAREGNKSWTAQLQRANALEEEKKSLLIDLDKARTELAQANELALAQQEETKQAIDNLTTTIVYAQWNLIALIVMHDNRVFVPTSVLNFAANPDLRLRADSASDGVHLAIEFDELPTDTQDEEDYA